MNIDKMHFTSIISADVNFGPKLSQIRIINSLQIFQCI